MILSVKLEAKNKSNSSSQLPFEVKAASALGISVIADALDYIGAPIFALPIIGDIADGIVMALLYRLTGSKTSAAVNAIEFIPFVGDFIPTYTITTLIWIAREARKRRNRKSHDHQIINPVENNSDANARLIRLENSDDDDDNTALTADNERESLQTKFMRMRAILRSRALL
jgi:hypothetical protein